MRDVHGKHPLSWHYHAITPLPIETLKVETLKVEILPIEPLKVETPFRHSVKLQAEPGHRPSMSSFRSLFTFFTFFTFFFLASGHALAERYLITYTTDGRPLYQFIIYDQGETYGSEKFGTQGKTSTWTLNQRDINSIINAADYWGSLLGSSPRNTQPVSIMLGTYSIDNADAISFTSSGGLTEVAAAIINNYFESSSPLAQIRQGFSMGAPHRDYTGFLEVLPHNGDPAHIAMSMAHEMGHAMGISSATTYDDEFDRWAFDTMASSWNNHLYDSYGTRAKPGMLIKYDDTHTGTSPDTNKFYLTGNPQENFFGYAYFQGSNTALVLDGAILGGTKNPGGVEGVPIKGYERDYDENDDLFYFPELSHIELRNSMMSHQSYRNYVTFMEAELAILQDIGYNIDRKNFFGYSIYGDGGDITVTQGYSARNAEGTAYLPGQYNPTAVAIGLHVYGTGNTISMQADVLSSGFGAAGIRVDGWDNALTIEPGIRIHANGVQGTGLMVAYGKDQSVIHRGEIQAMGQDGIGVRFDFGDNSLGNTIDYRGSYLLTDDSGPSSDLLPELEGALVSHFDVSGSIYGQAAAIYISPNALVETITIMNGAHIQGDILSDWDPENPALAAPPGTNLETALNFGYLADASGKATPQTDPNFNLFYRGNIQGKKSLNVTVADGTLTYGGQMDVKTFTLASPATLQVPASSSVTTTIQAANVTLESGSSVGITVENGALYGAELPENYVVLRLASDGTIDNQSTLIDSSGNFIRGVFDYHYFNPRWENDVQEHLLYVSSTKTLSKTRAATASIGAPLAITAQNPFSRQYFQHQSRQFAWKHSGGAVSMLPAPASGTSSLAETGSASDEAWTMVDDGEFRRGNTSFWVTSAYDHTRHRGESYKIRTPGISLGLDSWVNNNYFIGGAFSASRPSYSATGTDVDGTSVSAMLYGGLILPYQLDLGLFTSFNHTGYNQKRWVYGTRYKSDYDSRAYSVGMSLARSFDAGASFDVRPFLSYEYTRLEVGRRDEKNGLFALDMGKSDHNLHRIETGLELTHNFENRGFVTGRLLYSGQWGDRGSASDIYFVHDPGKNGYRSRGYALDRDAIGVGFSFGLPVAKNTIVSGGYTYFGSTNATSHQAHLNLNRKF